VSSKHVEDTKNRIKTLIWKVCICWFTLHNCITTHGTKTLTLLFLNFKYILWNSLLRYSKFHPLTDHESLEGEWKYSSILYLASARDGGGWSTPRPCSLMPWRKTRYPFYTRPGGPRDGLDGCGKSRLHRDSIPGPSGPWPVAISSNKASYKLIMFLWHQTISFST
jgi:hypothetical protein